MPKNYYYKQLSGAKKRELKRKRDVQLKSCTGSMEKYVKLVNDSESCSEVVYKCDAAQITPVADDNNREENESSSDESEVSNVETNAHLQYVSRENKMFSEGNTDICADKNMEISTFENGEIASGGNTEISTDKDTEISTDEETKILLSKNTQTATVEKIRNENDNKVFETPCDTQELKSYLYASEDIGFWPEEIDDEFREYFLKNKPNDNIDKISVAKNYVILGKNRSLKESNFYRKTKNGKVIKREWLIYSPVKSSVFCYVCKLFSSSNQALCKEGFSYWKNTSERLQEHENSAVHRNSVLCLSQRLLSAARIDSKLVEEYEAECLYWRKVLRRVVASIKFLAQRGLAFYGDDETVNSSQNGNFLGCLELLGQFDSFISGHLEKYSNPGTGNVNYLSSTIVSEIIEIMGQEVLNVIVAEVKKSRYFGLIVDSTQDITHTDQLAVVLRYVNDAGEPVERFIKFLNIHSHQASHLTSDIICLLKELGVDISNCRGQSYDNASNMSGKYSGLQSQIKELSPLAEYIPCSAHSLNLVGHNSVECCEKATSFFGLVQNLYVFFSCSTRRWEILSKKLSGGLTLKALSATRWSAAADATKCLKNNYSNIISALQLLIDDACEKPAVRHEAKALRKKLEKFETAILAIVWDTILQRLNGVNKTLQATGGNISILKPLFDSLINFVQSVRDNFEQYETEASTLIEKCYEEKRKVKIPSNKFLDESKGSSVQLTGRDAFIYQCHYVICDSLIAELNKRKSAYLQVENSFGFLVKKCSEEEMKKAAKKFQTLYNSDIDEDFIDEISQFFHFFPDEVSPGEKLKFIRSQNIQHTFPNVDTALQILLTLPISNCASERSFSVLKRIKNRLRSTVKQDNLASLSILSIESTITAKLDFENVINVFASKKARKKPLINK